MKKKSFYNDIVLYIPIYKIKIYYEKEGGGTQLVNKNNGIAGY